MRSGAPPEAETIRNSRVFLGLMRLLAIASWLMAPCLLILAVASLVPLRALSFNGVLGAVLWAGTAVGVAGLGQQMWVWARGMAGNHVVLDPAGAHFHFFSAPRQQTDVFVAWDEIESVTQRRNGNVMIFSVVCRGDRKILFTPLTFFRAKRVARRVAAGAAKTLTKV